MCNRKRILFLSPSSLSYLHVKPMKTKPCAHVLTSEDKVLNVAIHVKFLSEEV